MTIQDTDKKLHEKWSELVTGKKDGLNFDPTFSSANEIEIPPITHAFGKSDGYEIHVRSGVYYASYSEMSKKDKTVKEIEIPLFSSKAGKLSFPYKFKVKGKEQEFTEAEFQEIESVLRSKNL